MVCNGPESARLGQKPKSLIAIAKKVPNFKLYMMVSQWKGDMPGWKSMLNEDETIDLKNYILVSYGGAGGQQDFHNHFDSSVKPCTVWGFS